MDVAASKEIAITGGIGRARQAAELTNRVSRQTVATRVESVRLIVSHNSVNVSYA
jgi:hypothetical protein